MTIEAKKRERVRRSRVPLGEIRRGAGGDIEMIEFVEYRANPLAPTILVNKVGGIYRVTPNITKVTFVLATPGPGGIIEHIERGSLLWETSDWYDSHEVFRWAMAEIRRGTFHQSSGGGRTRTQ